MHILVSNDDGVYAPGIICLAQALLRAGYRVTVVSPDRERSATGHGLTLHKPLRVEPANLYYDAQISAWSCSGTPADCVKLALDGLLQSPPDWVVSGINQGSNLGTDVFYSGTVAAALEGFLNGIPSMAVSLTSFTLPEFDPAAQFVCDWLAAHPRLPQPMMLNVNVPANRAIRGVVTAPLGVRRYIESFDKRVDPRGKVYYWIAGEVVDSEAAPDSDIAAAQAGYITMTPLHINLTAAADMAWLQAHSVERFAPQA